MNATFFSLSGEVLSGRLARVVPIVFLVLVCSTFSSAQKSQLRPLTPDDILRMEGIGETALSPDGQWLAYVRKRPNTPETFRGYSELLKNDHGDIWIASVTSGTQQNITNGATDGSGWWAPRWSPDGQRLLMLSTKGGNIRLWMWTKATGILEMVCERAVDVVSVDSFWDSYLWISARQLVVGVLPPGKKPHAMDDTEVFARIESEWAKVWKGQEPTASVLESGIPPSMDNRTQVELLTIDIVTNEQKKITSAPGFGQFALSPDKKRLAFLKQVSVWQPNPNKMVTMLNPAIYQLEVADVQAAFQIHAVTEVPAALQGSLLWSPDSSELAFIAYTEDSAADQTVYGYRIADGRIRSVTGDMKDLNSLTQNRFTRLSMLWLGNRELLLFSRLETTSARGNKTLLDRWYAIDGEGHRRDLFRGESAVPTQVLRVSDGGHLIALIDGTVRRVDENGQLLESVIPDFKQKIASIVWTDRSLLVTNFRSRLVLTADSVNNSLIVRTDPLADSYYEIDLKSGEVQAVGTPSQGATLIAWNATAGTSVFLASDHTGTYLTARLAAAKLYVPILQTNTFLREIWHADLKKIRYRSLDGQELTGWVMLPYGFEQGKLYPLVAWIYPGSVYTDKFTRLWRWVDVPDPYNMQFLAARGYAVLFPSMPLKPYGEREEIYNELTKGVLPAVEKVVELGIADTRRIGVMGASFGGFATNGLITQTNRFRAAVAICGISNFVSMWGTFGTFDRRSRYDSFAHEDPFRMWNTETLGMGNPPWKAFGRYLRNSPINYIDRVQTPLLIIHGEVDGDVPLQQAEEYFTALYRQKKRARFVRYWGEDHTIQGPANIKDMWRQILDWFDEFLAPEVIPTSQR